MIKYNTNTLWWLYNIYKKAFHQPLNIKDTNFIKFDEFTGSASKQLELNWNSEVEKSKNPNLLKVLIKSFGLLPLIFGGIYLFIEMISRILIPFYVGRLISYYTSDEEPVSNEDLHRSIVGLVTFLLLTAFLCSPLKIFAFEIGIKMRVACSSLVYEKLLNITDPNISGLGLGLLTNDVQNLDNLLIGINHIWKTPLEAFIIVYIIYYEIGLPAIFGMIVMLTLIPIQTVLTRQINDCEMHLDLAIDKRVSFVEEIIERIKMIKLCTWEKLFDKTAQKLREREITIISQRSYLFSILYSLNILPRVAMLVTIVMFVWNGNLLISKHIFMLSLYYQFLHLSITQSFPTALAEYRQAVNSVYRIQQFLLKVNGNKNQINDLLRDRVHNTTSLEKGVSLDNVSASWNDDNKDGIYSIDLVLHSDRIYGITGGQGCGKSALLNTIVAELEPKEGKIEIRGTISYGSQEPWLFNTTIRQNILIGQEFDENRYKTVCRICALDPDFEILKLGDATIADGEGQCLGEQLKSKINLARSIYREADIYLIDNPLCIDDSHAGPYIFENCFQKFLKGKCVVLVTNNMKYLKSVNQIILMSDGRIIPHGNFDLLFKKYCSDPNDVVNYSPIRGIELIETASQDIVNTDSNLKIIRRGPLSILQDYYQILENNKLIGIGIALIFFTQISMSGIDIFVLQCPKLQDLKTMSFKDDLLGIKSYLYMYTILMIFLGYSTFKRTLTMFQISLDISRKLHNRLCQVISSATLQFYTRSTSGTLIQNFSHDMKNIDLDLSMDLADCLTFLVEAIFIIVWIATTNQLLIGPSLAGILICYGSREIIKKVLEHMTNIELVQLNTFQEHINSSLQGAITIRAFNAKSPFINKFNKCQDNSLTITYLRNLTLNLFTYIIDITSCFYIITVIVSYLFMSPSEITGNRVGLAITQVFILKCICEKGMRKLIDVEIRLPSVSNILKNCNFECEFSATPHDLLLTKDFNKRSKYGHISFKNVNLKTRDNKLIELNFEIKPNETITILGMETSLMINALYRFDLPECGVIKIDGFDIEKVNLEHLRRHITVISQDPIIFSGTVRYNLDPLNERSDSELMKLLHQIIGEDDLDRVLLNLHDSIEYLNLRQKQIICMARSLLPHNKIVIVDESTGNVGTIFNSIIHRTLQKLCADCTIIILAKHLNNIMKCDRVMILDEGRLVEYDHHNS